MRQTIQMKKTNNNKKFDQGYDEFILNCRVRNLSPETIKHYDSTMMTIYKFIPPKTPIKDITIDVVNKFILSCKSDLNVKGCDYFYLSKRTKSSYVLFYEIRLFR